MPRYPDSGSRDRFLVHFRSQTAIAGSANAQFVVFSLCLSLFYSANERERERCLIAEKQKSPNFIFLENWLMAWQVFSLSSLWPDFESVGCTAATFYSESVLFFPDIIFDFLFQILTCELQADINCGKRYDDRLFEQAFQTHNGYPNISWQDFNFSQIIFQLTDCLWLPMPDNLAGSLADLSRVSLLSLLVHQPNCQSLLVRTKAFSRKFCVKVFISLQSGSVQFLLESFYQKVSIRNFFFCQRDWLGTLIFQNYFYGLLYF